MRFAFLLALLLGACSNPTTTTREDVVVERPSRPPIAPFDECVVTTFREPALGAMHFDVCSELALDSFPPTGGNHYDRWATWGTYDAPIPWGFLVHSMEHGGVVLAYRCDDACPEVVAELRAIADGIDDSLCRGEPVPRRVIIVPMPDLDVAVAALTWEHGYVATCLDPPSLRAFVDAHYGMAPEDLCIPGVDDSATGWCP